MLPLSFASAMRRRGTRYIWSHFRSQIARLPAVSIWNLWRMRDIGVLSSGARRDGPPASKRRGKLPFTGNWILRTKWVGESLLSEDGMNYQNYLTHPYVISVSL